VELRGNVSRKPIFFNPIACCFLHKAQGFLAPLVTERTVQNCCAVLPLPNLFYVTLSVMQICLYLFRRTDDRRVELWGGCLLSGLWAVINGDWFSGKCKRSLQVLHVGPKWHLWVEASPFMPGKIYGILNTKLGAVCFELSFSPKLKPCASKFHAHAKTWSQ
jgi:hypothetical protein